jgi:hypothetical protein
MTSSNLRIYHNLTFAEYQRLDGHSYSQIKADGREFEPTVKMIKGTLVHRYLCEPQNFEGDISLIKPLALALKSVFGDLWEHLQHEASVTCDMEHEGFTMPYRGKIDSFIKNKLVIDYKVGEKVRKSMDWFGYKHQVNGYGCSVNAGQRYLIAINPKDKRPVPDIIPVALDHSWWEEQIFLKGRVL